MMRVSVDLHDVIADYVLGAIRKFGWPETWEGRLGQWWPENVIGSHFEPHTHSNFLRGLNVINGAIDGLFKLTQSSQYEPSIVTATAGGGPEANATLEWWREHLLPDIDIHFVGNLHKKIKFLEENRSFEWVIDDMLPIVEAMGERGRNTICIASPWNQTEKSWPSVHRVRGWDGVREVLGI